MDAQDGQDMGKEEGIPPTTNMTNSHIMHKMRTGRELILAKNAKNAKRGRIRKKNHD